MDNLSKVKQETERLYNDIDSCISELLKARIEKDTEAEGKALFKMEGLMVGIVQHLTCVIDSLQAEPSNDLEKEIICAYEHEDGIEFDKYRRIARYYAEWGAIHFNARKEE